MEPTEVSRALAATASLTSELGLTVDDAIVVQNSNRLAVRLVPCDVLVRIAAQRRQDHDVAAFEVEMARQLETADSLVGQLEPRVEPIVHVRDGFAVTYWKYYEPLSTRAIAAADYAQALEGVHAQMREIDAVAPHFTDRVDEAQTIVQSRSQSPDLSDIDRELLTHSLRSLRQAVVERTTNQQLLHGEPHVGNLLNTADGIRFVDLQTCCYGPVEFDVAHAPDEVGPHYSSADPVQLRDCRMLMRAMVAAWRADRDDELPGGHQMLDQLLGEIRDADDHPGGDGHR